MKIDIHMHLPDQNADVVVTFSATFNYMKSEWDDAEDILIEYVDDEDGEPVSITDLDRSSHLIVMGRIEALLEEHIPSDDEIARVVFEELGCRDYHDYAEMVD